MQNVVSKSKGVLSTFATVILVALTVFFIMDFVSAQIDTRRLEKQLEVTKENLESAQRNNEALKKQKEKLSDPEYMKDYARGNFMLSQEGEQIFILPSEDNQ